MADNRQFFYNNLIGMGIPPQAALGALYSLQGESHTALDPTAVGLGGDFGVAQWTGPRKAGLNAMAKALGTSPTDPNTQWQFMKSELVGPYSHVLQGLQNAKTAADATNIWTTQYEAPQINNWQQRYNAGIKTTSLGDNNALALKGGNDAPIAASSATPGTTLTSAAPQQSPAQMFAQGNIGGGIQQMFKQGMPQQAQQALGQAHPQTSQQELAPMQAPNVQAHRPDESMAMQMLASLQNQGVRPPVQNQGGGQMGMGQMGMGMPTMGALGMQYPYGMMGFG